VPAIKLDNENIGGHCTPLQRYVDYFCQFIIQAGSWDYRFLNPRSRDWERHPGLQSLPKCHRSFVKLLYCGDDNVM